MKEPRPSPGVRYVQSLVDLRSPYPLSPSEEDVLLYVSQCRTSVRVLRQAVLDLARVPGTDEELFKAERALCVAEDQLAMAQRTLSAELGDRARLKVLRRG